MLNYNIIYLTVGFFLFCASFLPGYLKGTSLSLPIVWVIFGVLLQFFIPHASKINFFQHSQLMEHLAEITVLISLVSTGLKIDRRMGWQRWKDTWLVLGISMPLAIAALALSAYYLLALPASLALLLGAIMAPTDPVLASGVQVGPPGEQKEHHVRFVLTSEAGLNDALAFPFVLLALSIFSNDYSSDLLIQWVLGNGIKKITLSILLGLVIGWVSGWYWLNKASKKIEGFVALALMFTSYALTELMHGYGFLAVFLAAYTFRSYHHKHKHHFKLHEFSEEIERLLVFFFLIILGISLAQGLTELFSTTTVIVALLFMIIIRPLTGLIGLSPSRSPFKYKLAISFFGIRGIGSFYYLSYTLNRSQIPLEYLQTLWGCCILIILISIVLHGLSITLLWPKLIRPSVNTDSHPDKRRLPLS